MNLWTIIAPLSSLITGIGLQLIAYDLDKATSKILRHLVSAIGLVFIIAFFELAFAKRPFPDTANWVFLALAVMIVAVAIYKGIDHQINKSVLRICVAALGLLIVAWLVGSCADNKRQKGPLDHLKIENPRATDREKELEEKHNI